MLRFAFMGDILGKKKSLEFLAELVERIREHVLALKEHLKTQKNQMTVTGVYALEQGIAKYQATLRWAKYVIKDFQGK